MLYLYYFTILSTYAIIVKKLSKQMWYKNIFNASEIDSEWIYRVLLNII